MMAEARVPIGAWQQAPCSLTRRSMTEPTQCVLWLEPELAEPLKDRFSLVETYVDEAHWWRHLLECRECGQLYFFEFYERIDWEGGDDPQYTTFVPVDGQEEIERLKACSPFELLQFSPRLQKDFPKDAKRPTFAWVGRP
jgi:hypothetical protein